MRLERRRDGVFKSSNGFLPAFNVRKDREVGIEELIRLGDGNRERNPISSIGDGLELNVIFRQPLGHGGGGLIRGTRKSRDLQTSKCDETM